VNKIKCNVTVALRDWASFEDLVTSLGGVELGELKIVEDSPAPKSRQQGTRHVRMDPASFDAIRDATRLNPKWTAASIKHKYDLRQSVSSIRRVMDGELIMEHGKAVNLVNRGRRA